MRLLIIAATIALCASVADAQEAQLKEVDSLAVVIKDLQDGAKSCGLDQAELRQIAVRQISGSKIKLASAQSNDPIVFYIEAGGLQPNSNLCTGSVNISLWDRQLITAHGTTQYRRVLYWLENYDVASSQDNFAQAVKDTVENSTKKFITQWNLDQK